MGQVNVNDNKLDVVAEQVSNLSENLTRIERNLEKVSGGMESLIEFRKEAEFLNKKVALVESSLSSISETQRNVQMEIASQNARNRIFSMAIGIAASSALALTINAMGNSDSFREGTNARITSLEKDSSIIKYQLARDGNPPAVSLPEQKK